MRKKWQPTPVFLLGKFHGQRSLASYSPWGRKELDMTQRLHFLFFPCSSGSEQSLEQAILFCCCPEYFFSVVVQSLNCLTLCDPMDCRASGFPVLHCLPEFAQTSVHWVGDAIQPSHPLSSPSPPALSFSQHQDQPCRFFSRH